MLQMKATSYLKQRTVVISDTHSTHDDIDDSHNTAQLPLVSWGRYYGIDG
jgi:hypothetical protein